MACSYFITLCLFKNSSAVTMEINALWVAASMYYCNFMYFFNWEINVWQLRKWNTHSWNSVMEKRQFCVFSQRMSARGLLEVTTSLSKARDGATSREVQCEGLC